MNQWQPDDDANAARRIGKTLEELGELTAVLARISIQGIDAIDPSSGKTNRQRFEEETADVVAQINCNIDFSNMSTHELAARSANKQQQMGVWEGLYEKNDHK
jgi:NTP pyrophosphatase (non-canonical NTP hydrolase)